MRATKEIPYDAELRRIVRGSAWLMGILETVRECDPPDWLVGGGVLYKLVWNRLHGYAETAHIKDVDVVFFEREDLSPERERRFERDLFARRPDVPWDAKNQAAVHLWYAEKFGYGVPPLDSSEAGVEANPATATAVGVRLLADDSLYVAAPLGLSDLFGLVVRRNPRRVTPEMFYKWVVEKGFREKWPRVRVVEETRPVTL
jgi:uncharacterized protein